MIERIADIISNCPEERRTEHFGPECPRGDYGNLKSCTDCVSAAILSLIREEVITMENEYSALNRAWEYVAENFRTRVLKLLGEA